MMPSMPSSRERDVSDVDPSDALQTLVTMETLNMMESSEGSIRSLICCPVRNERSENVIGKSLSQMYVFKLQPRFHLTNYL